MATALSGLKVRSFSLVAGEDYSFTLFLEPPASVVGQTYEFRAVGEQVSFTFPPTTVVPADNWFYPCLPVVLQQLPSLDVVPGITPRLPAHGSASTLLLDNSTTGGVSVSDSSTGEFLVTIAASLTRTLAAQNFSWWFRRIDSGHNLVVKSGSFSLLPSLIL